MQTLVVLEGLGVNTFNKHHMATQRTKQAFFKLIHNSDWQWTDTALQRIRELARHVPRCLQLLQDLPKGPGPEVSLTGINDPGATD